ncbi:MAG: hypothetical protein PHS93_02720 [Candidatus Omnitrophica bacterium]|nr:hypothetical protein [Candidatus Omnitrophota bacterium]MDD5352063.1 hypothetical protein [Candidatus Omnitrophota bacterium]MDD5549661.1 hypothetical protein [Candidatus Omnitrophota bacterium]
MEGNFSLNSYLDPIAKIWGNNKVQLPLFSKRAKTGLKKARHKKLKK